MYADLPRCAGCEDGGRCYPFFIETDQIHGRVCGMQYNEADNAEKTGIRVDKKRYCAHVPCFLHSATEQLPFL